MYTTKKNMLSISKIIVLLCLYSANCWSQPNQPFTIEKIELSGYIGKRINDCIAHRVKAQDANHLIEPFRQRTETNRWQTEFWGKWILGAIASYRYNQDPELLEIIKNAVAELVKTQTADGYIGNYSPEAQLTHWDIWGRKYTLLGLLAYYDLTKDTNALESGKRLVDHLLTQVGPEHANIVKTGNYRGMPSSSIVEPILFLYKLTQENKYLDFAKYIVNQWETPDGPQLISKAINNIPVAERFPAPETWWSWENGQKAYEMMSCYEGLLELYKITKNPLYLHAVEKAVDRIIEDEINIAGSGSAFECWYNGQKKQTQPTYHTMETCVTFTWMQLCNRLLQITGNSLYADQIEITGYNALMASLKEDASQIAKYSPLEGCRHEGEEQCGMHINCCNANGPRAFALLPQVAYQISGEQINVNLYGPSSAQISLGKKQSIKIAQQTNYPINDIVEIGIDPNKPSTFTLALRIPAWSDKTLVKINGKEIPEHIEKGSYLPITRKWNKGDKISLQLDLRGRVLHMNGAQAIVRGPIVLARDSRYNDGDIDESAVIVEQDGSVVLTPDTDTLSFAWMSFTVPMKMGTDLESKSPAKQIRFCDFGSAGNAWDNQQRYRVWLPETLHVMNEAYKQY